MEKEVAPLMASLTASTGKNVTLTNFWNTFDELNTQRDAILLDSKLSLNQALSEPTWSQANFLLTGTTIFVLIFGQMSCIFCFSVVGEVARQVNHYQRIHMRIKVFADCRSWRPPTG